MTQFFYLRITSMVLFSLILCLIWRHWLWNWCLPFALSLGLILAKVFMFRVELATWLVMIRVIMWIIDNFLSIARIHAFSNGFISQVCYLWCTGISWTHYYLITYFSHLWLRFLFFDIVWFFTCWITVLFTLRVLTLHITHLCNIQHAIAQIIGRLSIL
jgi:hypothetical protein